MTGLINATALTRVVLDRHLAAFAQGLDVLIADYDEQSVLITPDQTYRGREEIRPFFETFLANADEAFWNAMAVRTIVVESEIAYVVWEAPPFVSLASDTLYIRNGRIAVQSFTSFST